MSNGKIKTYKPDLREFDENTKSKKIRNNLIVLFLFFALYSTIIVFYYVKGFPSYYYYFAIVHFIIFAAIQVKSIVKIKKRDFKKELLRNQITIKKDMSNYIESFILQQRMETFDMFYEIKSISELLHKDNKIVIKGEIEAYTKYDDDYISNELEFKKRLKIISNFENMDEIHSALSELKAQNN